MPDEYGELSGGGDGCDLVPTLFTDAMEEGAKRPRTWGQSPGGFDQHCACMATTAPGDVTMERRTIAGLMNTRVEPQIAHELFRTGEAMYIPDCREHAARYHRVNAADRHQPLYI